MVAIDTLILTLGNELHEVVTESMPTSALNGEAVIFILNIIGGNLVFPVLGYDLQRTRQCLLLNESYLVVLLG